MKKIIAFAVATLVAASLAACTLPKKADAEPTFPPLPPAAQAEKDNPTPEPAPEPPAPALGTIKNPAPVGVPITSTGFDGTTYDTTAALTVNPANEYIAQTNQFNDAAPAGYHYIVVTLTITNTSADAAKGIRPGTAAYDVSVVDEATGQSFSHTSTVLPNSISGQNEIYSGQTAVGEQAYLVPDTAGALLIASGGVFVRL
ncbi:hypothetical protein [Agromyces larvae]|uniref:DUF4352 domain-containing protein n=1 Tax=Agromyces larvae TaxID=2929802 RepID=A0ABY4C3N8_9MICO|nr:hypothetical protein [Agromyces larvae]UOE45934.1 hypothetical protein MTO99_09395 [Agromyces larvae]